MMLSFESQLFCESLMWAWYAAEEIEIEVGDGYCHIGSSFVDGTRIGSSLVDGVRISASFVDGCKVGASFVDGCFIGSSLTDG